MIGLNVYYHVKPDMMGDFIEELTANDIDEISRRENGCIQYEYFLPLNADDNVLLLVERWETAEAQRIHTTQPHTAILKEIKEKYVEETEFFNYSECN